MVVAAVLVGLVALIHIYIVVLEMFLWDTPKGRKTFGTTPEFSAESKVLAANQGLYNGFLAAGLIWSLVWAGGVAAGGRPIAVFFLACVLVAGLYGAATVGKKILFVQAIPAAAALAAVLLLT
jgi:putative membrane protein